jgi:hypothetical protein
VGLVAGSELFTASELQELDDAMIQQQWLAEVMP